MTIGGESKEDSFILVTSQRKNRRKSKPKQTPTAKSLSSAVDDCLDERSAIK